MPLNITVPAGEEPTLKPRITVVGVGGAGGNAVDNMIEMNLEGVEFVCANTDAQALAQAKTTRRIQLGHDTTQGLGAGARPEIGRVAAEEAVETIASELQGSNMVFITAGMGGGTGTGAAPVVASVARELGVLTVGVVTKPFQFEGQHRARLAEAGIDELAQFVDTLIIIPNQNLFRVANERTTFADAFKMADDVLYSGVRSVTDLMINPGLINLDFADVRTVMQNMGRAMMGTGEAEGEHRALEAAEAAIANPLLEDTSMRGARGVLINITGGSDVTLYEVDEAANRIRDEVENEAHIIFGSSLDPRLDGRIRVSVVATGIDAAMEAGGRDEHPQRSLEVRGTGPSQAAAAPHIAAPKAPPMVARAPAAAAPAAPAGPMVRPNETSSERVQAVAAPQTPAAAVSAPAAQAPAAMASGQDKPLTKSQKAQEAVRMLESLVMEANTKQSDAGLPLRSEGAAPATDTPAATKPMMAPRPAPRPAARPAQKPTSSGSGMGRGADGPTPLTRPRVPSDAFIPAPAIDMGNAATARALDMDPQLDLTPPSARQGQLDMQPHAAVHAEPQHGYDPAPHHAPAQTDADGWTIARDPQDDRYADDNWSEPDQEGTGGFRPSVVAGARAFTAPSGSDAAPSGPFQSDPAPAAAPEPTSRPSLLARITGLGARHTEREKAKERGDANPLLSAKTLSVSQGETEETGKSDDQLDIPTFLRRQVN